MAVVEGGSCNPSAEEKLGLCATHAGTARAQMGAGYCLGSSLEGRMHTSAYMFLSSLVASLLASASPKFLCVPLWGGCKRREGPDIFPGVSSP